MKHPLRLLALDLDGTSLNAAKHITPAVRQALLDAMAAGVTVVPASGRPLTGLSEEFLALPGVNYALTSNGAAVYRLSDRARIYERCLDTRLAAELMRRLEQLDIVATFFANGQGYASQRQLAFLPRLDVTEPVRDYLRTTRTSLTDPAAFILEHGRVEKFTLNYLPAPGGGRVDGEKVRALLEEFGLKSVSGGTNNDEITAPGADKGAGLLALADHLGIPREQTMACGDSENDLAMLDAAGFAVAMANSEACVFPHADAVTASNEEDGVAKAVYKYVLI